jgi:phosphohistidine phosphatase
MKTLLLLRHAKASRDDPQLPDHDRPLKERGKEDAKRLGRRLRVANLSPSLIISSTAVRARKTASKVAKQLDYARAIELADRLYLSTPRDHFEVARSLPDSENRVMLVGHNPGLSQFLSNLTDTQVELATSELGQVELQIDHWAELENSGEGRLIRLWQPGDRD